MEFEPDRAGLDIPDSGEEKGSQQFAVSEAAMNPCRDLLEEFVARSVFEESDQRLKIGMELDDLRAEPRFLGSDAGQSRGKGQIAESEQCGSGQGSFEKTPAAGSSIHNGRLRSTWTRNFKRASQQAFFRA